jgi:putative CocE/NonD family hydrolase
MQRHRAIGVALLAAALLVVPSSVHGQQAEVVAHPMRVAYNVKVRVRDGIHLSADIFRPSDDAKHPVILTITPYNNDSENAMDEAWSYVRRGYAFVTVDARGRYDSEGIFDPFRNDGRDGSDVMDWIAAQPWASGRIATVGGSYVGKNQWMMAKEHNPHHVAMVSYVSPADDFRDGSRYNGVPKLDLMFTWMMGMDGHVNQSRAGWNWAQAMRGLPLLTLDSVVGRRISFWRDVISHRTLDAYWMPVHMTGFYDRFDIPSFNVTGWYEGQLKGQTQNYVNARQHSKTPDAYVLVIGPWLHGVNRNRVIGERDAGPEAIIDLNALRDAWLDQRMLGGTPPVPAQPNFLYFLPGKNEWRSASRFPVPGMQAAQFFLESGGKANTLTGDGTLLRGRPGSGPADQFTYDPANPVPSVSSRTAGARGGLPQGSVDNRAVEARPDVLVYTSEPLAEGLEITGPVTASIHFETDVVDTDIAVKLLDVYPDGRALNLTEGIARAQYRQSYSAPTPLTPGKVTKVDVELFPTSNWFEAGHRIRIEVASSDFPNFARNLNTEDSDTGTAIKVAHTRVLHTSAYPSSITLPLVPNGATQRWNPPMPKAAAR